MMRSVIKSGDRSTAASVRGLAVAPSPPPVSEEAQRISELEAKLAQADVLIISLRDETKSLATAVVEARRAGHAEGLIEGQKAAEDRSQTLLALVGQSAVKASNDFRLAMSSLEDLAASLAGVALSRVVGDPCSRREIVELTVQRALAEALEGSVLTVEVSRADFPDPAALEMMERPAHARSVQVRAVDGLPTGGCRLQLRLGQMDLGLDGQVRRLRALLDPTGESA